MMYRYLVFAYDTYYPAGGLADLKFKTDNFEEAEAKAEELRQAWDHVDLEDMWNV